MNGLISQYISVLILDLPLFSMKIMPRCVPNKTISNFSECQTPLFLVAPSVKSGVTQLVTRVSVH